MSSPRRRPSPSTALRTIALLLLGWAPTLPNTEGAKANRTQQATEDSLEQEIARLVERTNALDAFHLVYTGTITEEGEPTRMDIVLAYRAPDHSYLRMSGPRGEFENWYLGGEMYLHSVAQGWQRAAFPKAPPRHLQRLDELFPPPPTALPPGTRFDLLPGSSRSGAIRIRTSHLPFGRSHLFSWLDWLRARGKSVETDERTFTTEGTTEGPGFRMVFSRESGFLTSYSYSSSRQSAELELERAAIEAPPELFELPEEAAEASENEPIQKQIDYLFSSTYVRRGGFGRVGVGLQRERLEWNDEVRGRWIEFLEELHRPQLAKATKRSRDEILEQLAAFEGSKPAHHEELRTRVLAAADRSLEIYLGGLPEVPAPEPFLPALFECEEEVVTSIFDATFRTPILERLEELRAGLR